VDVAVVEATGLLDWVFALRAVVAEPALRILLLERGATILLAALILVVFRPLGGGGATVRPVARWDWAGTVTLLAHGCSLAGLRLNA
jgi:hypothetical protein